MENKNVYSSELQGVLTYMVDSLGQEFPSSVYTPEHLIVALMDNKKCHANMILDNCLMSGNLKKLKTIYIDYLNKNFKNNAYVKSDGIVNFNEELNRIMNDSEREYNTVKSSKKIGTEHLLLAMLNPDTKCQKIQDVFKNMGVDYNFILNRCVEVSKNAIISSNKNMEKNQIINIIKSQVNPKAVSTKTEYISNYTISLNSLANEGKLDKLIGREKEVEMVIKVLARRKKNNVILVGNGGCGKTAIVNGIAQRITNNDVPPILQGKEVVQLNVMALVSGTHFRGMMEERVKGLFDELKANKNYILFLDDIQQVVKTSSKDKDTDISSMISDILTEGDVSVIGTTTFKDYRNGIESNTSLSRKLQKIIIEPNTIEESVEILKANKIYYENYHHVSYDDDTIRKTVELAERYITDRSLPDSAFDVMDLAGAYTCLNNNDPDDIINCKKRLIELNKERDEYLNHGEFEIVDKLNIEENELKKLLADFNREIDGNVTNITLNDVALAVSDMTNIPINKLNSNEKEKIAHMEEVLKQSVVGQNDAIEGICRIIKRNKVGLGDKKRVLGAVLMIGPSGVGKTLIAKKLAEEIFGSERDLVRIDMSEYSEKNSVAKLTGAAPGYIGYENGGQLTEAIKNKQHCVLLLDEIEKADQEVYNLFLQLFDEGRLTDSAGQIVNFKNVIVLMTSNIGAKQASEFSKGTGFINDENTNKKSIIEKQLKKTFTPEFINRIDQIVHFNPLTDESLKSIVKLELNKFGKRLNEINFALTYDDKAVEYLYSLALKQKEYGARPIIRLIQDNIEDKITDLILLNEYEINHVFNLSCENNEIIIN